MPHRNQNLDGLRGFAMLLVFFYHYVLIPPETWIDKLYLGMVHYSWVGMHLFFALSGYLITGILLDTKEDQHYFSNFYGRRFLRIFPLYYLLLVIAIYILPKFNTPNWGTLAEIKGDEWSYWTYLCNFTIGQAGKWRYFLVDLAWSLAVEEQFYILWPIVLYRLSPQRVFVLCIALILGALLCRVAFVINGMNDIALYTSTFARFDAIAAGSAVAAAMRFQAPQARDFFSRPIPYVIVSFLVAAAVLVPFRGKPEASPVEIFGHGAIAIFSAFLIGALVAPQPPKFLSQFFQFRLFRIVGAYSYGFYLFHIPIGTTIRDWLYPPEAFHKLAQSAFPGQILFLIGSGSAILAVSAISYHCFEARFLSLKKHFEYDSQHKVSHESQEFHTKAA